MHSCSALGLCGKYEHTEMLGLHCVVSQWRSISAIAARVAGVTRAHIRPDHLNEVSHHAVSPRSIFVGPTKGMLYFFHQKTKKQRKTGTRPSRQQCEKGRLEATIHFDQSSMYIMRPRFPPCNSLLGRC